MLPSMPMPIPMPVPNVDGVGVDNVAAVVVADVSRCNCCSVAVADAVVSG